jgi:hypothetical protein
MEQQSILNCVTYIFSGKGFSGPIETYEHLSVRFHLGKPLFIFSSGLIYYV